MTWLWLVFIAFFVVAAIIGWHRGFAKMLVALISTIAAIVVTWIFTPMITNLITEHTGLDESIATKIEETFFKDAEDDEEADGKVEDYPLPGSVKEPIRTTESTGETAMPKKTALSQKIAGVIVTALVALALFVISKLLLFFLGKLLDLVNKAPGLKQVNGALGMTLALVEAFVFLNLFFLLLVPLSNTGIGQYVVGEIKKSAVLTWLYENNLLVYLFNLAKHKLFG